MVKPRANGIASRKPMAAAPQPESGRKRSRKPGGRWGAATGSGAPGTMASTRKKSRFRKGTKKSTTSWGGRAAWRRRRRVMLTPIAMKGRAARTM
jgi:hypothetical protein